MCLIQDLKPDLGPSEQLARHFQRTLDHEREELINLKSGIKTATAQAAVSDANLRYASRAHSRKIKAKAEMRDNFSGPKQLKNFNKKLTSKHFMQADIQCEFDKQDYKDKVSECFDFRIK